MAKSEKSSLDSLRKSRKSTKMRALKTALFMALGLSMVCGVGFSSFVFQSGSSAEVAISIDSNVSITQLELLSAGADGNPIKVTSNGFLDDETYKTSGTVGASFSFVLNRQAAYSAGYVSNDGTSNQSKLSLSASLSQTAGGESYDFVSSAGNAYLAYGSSSLVSAASLSGGVLSATFEYQSSLWTGNIAFSLSFSLTIPSTVSNSYSSFYSFVKDGGLAFETRLEAIKP